jgi:hypothetical protein
MLSMSNRRIELSKRDGERFRCRATIGRFGTKPAYKGSPIRTIMLSNVRDVTTGALLTDHLWFTCGKWSDGIRVGNVIEFDARVGDYVKGYQGLRDLPDASPVGLDWKLQRPTKVCVVVR